MRVIPLPGKIGSPEFMTAYNAALAALNVREIGKTRSAPGTVSAAIAAYYRGQSLYRFGPRHAEAAPGDPGELPGRARR